VGAVLVGVKALLVAVLAGVMLLIRRPGHRVWLGAILASVAVLAMSRWLFLQPKIFSFLFLGLTVYLLNRESTGVAARGPLWLRPIIAIPVLFALWVNLDEWFILGPFAVALYLIGELLQQVIAPIRTGDDAPAPGHLGRLSLVFGVGLAACLLNPYHVRAFQVPSDLAPWVSGESPLQFDDAYKSLFQTPFADEYLKSVFKGPNWAGIAYYLLVLLGVASFLVNVKGWRGWRMILWLGFFLPSFFLARTIPFFAVVAGPITALNFQDFAAQRFGVALRLENPWKNWSLAGRFLTLTAGVALLFLAWPGMLNSDYEDPIQTRHVAWRMEMDPSLRQAAAKLAELRQDPELRDGNGFNFTPEIANYCAWFCPQEKGFLDQRFDLFPNRAGDFRDLRQALIPRLEKTGQDRPAPQTEWTRRLSIFQKHFASYGINHIVISGPSFRAIQPMVEPLWADPQDWTVLYQDGRTAIFGWKGPDAKPGEDPFRAHAFEPDTLAFGSSIPPEARAPSQGSEVPQAPSYLERYWSGPVPRSLDADASSMYQAYAQMLGRQAPIYFAARQAAWQILALAAPVNAANTGAFPGLACTYGRTSQFIAQNVFAEDRRLGPAAAAILAVRTARRAIAANPTDHGGYLELAIASQVLSGTQELPSGGSGTALQEIRRVQLLAALQNALALKPDFPDVNRDLAMIFMQMRYLDLGVEHWHHFLEGAEASGPKPRESTEDFKKRIDNIKLFVKDQEERSGVQRLKNEYALAERTQPTLARKANEAARRGLVKKALELLLNEDDRDQLGPQEVRLAMTLLINTGRLGDAKELAKELDDPVSNYLIAAGLGNYAEAEENLEKLIDKSQKAHVQEMLFLLRDQGFTNRLGSAGSRNAGPESLTGLSLVAINVRNWADFRVYQGVLALEQGDTAEATRYFQEALKVGATPASQTLVAGAFAPGSALTAVNFLEANLQVPQNSFNFSTRGIAERYLSMLQVAAQKKK
jgi:hypothetical protein